MSFYLSVLCTDVCVYFPLSEKGDVSSFLFGKKKKKDVKDILSIVSDIAYFDTKKNKSRLM